MYKHVKAIALGTVATSIGIMHFDPARDDEDGRYQTRVLPDADATKAKNRELVEITGDATKQEFDAQQAGYPMTGRVREIAVERVAQASEDESAQLAGETASATANLRNFPAGAGPDAVPSGGDPDAAPRPSGAGGDAGAPKILKQSVPKLTESLKGISDSGELAKLLKAEEDGQNRDGAKAAIEARSKEIANA